MSTVYNIQVVSHWVNYSEDELLNKLKEAVKKLESESNNEITIEVKKK